ncbi:ribosome silencing factor [Reinekea sp. G2M2-21]|uniref:ribosome silencing factor n=1 Tax=Reinekea sp. G2M2-21 TaxID=2788942 RepID=UPI0018AAC11D|nr:ribosome silencing factor [Reinekea sp. G2M2-21]MDX1342896.1 ribosome silencing factor [Reinekea sp.]
MTDTTQTKKNAHNDDLIKNLVEALENIKATDIQIIDVSDKTTLMDTLVIASGTSTRHIAAVVESVATDMKKKGYAADHQEGQTGSDWVLLDFVDLVLHVMLPEARALYDLESLWSGLTPPAG